MKLIKRASIGVKMMVLVSALFLLCTGLSAAIYWNILESTSRRELERISAQTLSTINDGINSQLDYIHNFSIRLMMENSFLSFPIFSFLVHQIFVKTISCMDDNSYDAMIFL